MKAPGVAMQTTDGTHVDLSALKGLTVVYAYPRTSPPNEPPIDGWAEIPGAMGCTPQSCAFRDHHRELTNAGAAQVFGLSTQSTAFQQEAAARLNLPFPILSDENLALTSALGLPTFTAGGMALLKRLTFVLRDGRVEHVIFPVPDPARNAEDVLAYLKSLGAPA